MGPAGRISRRFRLATRDLGMKISRLPRRPAWHRADLSCLAGIARRREPREEDLKISTPVSSTVRLHRGCEDLLPQLLRLV
jgi:hypothetical protein